MRGTERLKHSKMRFSHSLPPLLLSHAAQLDLLLRGDPLLPGLLQRHQLPTAAGPRRTQRHIAELPVPHVERGRPPPLQQPGRRHTGDLAGGRQGGGARQRDDGRQPRRPAVG